MIGNEARKFSHLVDVYFDTRRNKRYGREAMAYEIEWPACLSREFRARKERSLRIDHNYAFLTSIPRWREIMATEFKGRHIDHELCEVVIPAAEAVLSPHTYNNRKGKGAQAAINQLIETIYEVTEDYTVPARIIKVDIKGYFPNARWDVAEREVCKVLDLTGRPDTDYLKWLAMIAINANPAAHCELRTPRHYWDEHIDPEKSVLLKPEGVGAAIGRLVWQTSMGLYINDEIKWLTEEAGIRAICFVDDIVMVVPEHRHAYALAVVAELRRRLAEKGVTLHPRKFYDQPATHGLEFLGSHIRPGRIHLNDKTYHQALTRVAQLNTVHGKRYLVDVFLSSVNSYFGLLKQRTDYRRMMELKDAIAPSWWEFVRWDEERYCVTCREEFSWRTRMDRKYHLKLNTDYGKRRTRNAA